MIILEKEDDLTCSDENLASGKHFLILIPS